MNGFQFSSYYYAVPNGRVLGTVLRSMLYFMYLGRLQLLELQKQICCVVFTQGDCIYQNFRSKEILKNYLRSYLLTQVHAYKLSKYQIALWLTKQQDEPLLKITKSRFLFQEEKCFTTLCKCVCRLVFQQARVALLRVPSSQDYNNIIFFCNYKFLVCDGSICFHKKQVSKFHVFVNQFRTSLVCLFLSKHTDCLVTKILKINS